MSYQRIGAVLIVCGLLFGLWYFGGMPGIPPTDSTSGDMSLVFYDANGDRIDNLAFVSGGTVISGFSANWVVSATGSVALKSGSITGTYSYKIYGINEFDKEVLLTTVEVNSYTVNDFSPPISWHSENYHSIGILDPYTSYRDKGGWKIFVYISATVTAVNDDSESLTADVTANAYFYIWWQAGTLQLTGVIGADPAP